MPLKIALVLSMLIQLGAAITAVLLIRRTRYNVSWILISLGFVLMAFRRLFEFSTLFWETQVVSKEEINNWTGVVISILMLTGLIYIRKIFTLQEQTEELRKEAEARLLKAVIQTEEKARQTFARELHDGLGPVLSSIKMTISAIEVERIDKSNQAIIERACKVTDEAIITLKEISNHLSPYLLKNYGLKKALENFFNNLLANSDIRFEINCNMESKRYNYDIEISIFRIICELLNNSIKHASPNLITASLTDNGEKISIEYQDNGCGFDRMNLTESSISKGMGLENIRSRIKSMDGDYHVYSEPGKGVRLNINIPVK
jgi:signal transduction histidine kinase